MRRGTRVTTENSDKWFDDRTRPVSPTFLLLHQVLFSRWCGLFKLCSAHIADAFFCPQIIGGIRESKILSNFASNISRFPGIRISEVCYLSSCCVLSVCTDVDVSVDLGRKWKIKRDQIQMLDPSATSSNLICSEFCTSSPALKDPIKALLNLEVQKGCWNSFPQVPCLLKSWNLIFNS